MKEKYRIKTTPKAKKENIILGEYYRITFLTEQLVRFEYNEEGEFEDHATQIILNRDFEKVDYRLIKTKDGIEIFTTKLHIFYNEKLFSTQGLNIRLNGTERFNGGFWRYGEESSNLYGTARTLDNADGEIKLGNGIISKKGYSVLDDSKSHILLKDGWVAPGRKGIVDFYFFGYGYEYKKALSDFYRLTGSTPLLPRFVFGNWWSRFYRYTQESYLGLMDRFEKENLPFSVAVIDMDWHLVDIDPKYGNGWTGYTWNKELFAEPEKFLENLHKRGMKTILNVHPADGIRAFEEHYEDIAKALGVDVSNEDPVNCDLADPDFIEAYFKFIHHPREKEGVDYWWIDWQQGESTKIEGLDPLWILNHFHFLDSEGEGKRPMTFSRYAGPGSHRYPIGFSGDTISTWESLDFQPYFTATAANIGYGWWSHDIGGHMLGYKDDEMAARWVELGVFSPILRLHSTSSEFYGKEPWRYKKETESVIGEALRERHRFIPYLYTMNYRNYKLGLPLVLPMYYEYPDDENAYWHKNQFYFGTELIVSPITSKRLCGLNVARVGVWLPKGKWYDIYTGMSYEGGRKIDMYRDLTSIPVLAKSGAIIPMTDEIAPVQAVLNPTTLRIKIVSGADNRFLLYEDDNSSISYKKEINVTTEFIYKEKKEVEFTIRPSKGDLSLLHKERGFVLEFADYEDVGDEEIKITADGKEIAVNKVYDVNKRCISILIPKGGNDREIKVRFPKKAVAGRNDIKKRSFVFLEQAEIAFSLKDDIYNLIAGEGSVVLILSELKAMNLDTHLLGVITEILTAY